jgi:hypothetical protein
VSIAIPRGILGGTSAELSRQVSAALVPSMSNPAAMGRKSPIDQQGMRPKVPGMPGYGMSLSEMQREADARFKAAAKADGGYPPAPKRTDLAPKLPKLTAEQLRDWDRADRGA